MLTIAKMRSDHVMDFAAEELKKYLRMMMPEAGEIRILPDGETKDGFRLGLMEDFGLPCEAKDAKFEDVVHIDADEKGGILAGSNPRSVLFSVYRFFKENGCRFLFPGPDGEIIPKQKVGKTLYHHKADHVFRGHTLEGTPSVRQVLDYIDFHAKEELNAFGLYDVTSYQSQYYYHRFNHKNRPSEGFDPDLAETQWRALYECEIKKRGLILFSGEHDLIPTAFGLDMSDRLLYKEGKKEFPEEALRFVALLNGKREFYQNDLFFTNVCMSNPVIRKRMARCAADFAKKNRHLDFYGVTVADLARNHCECDECKKMRPSDWYVVLLNEIDEELTKEGLDTKILFSFYTDMMFAPEREKIRNPGRFLLQYCPIHRSYSSSITENSVFPQPLPYLRNAWTAPRSSEETFSLFREWQKVFPGPYSVFEYHFWRKQYRDPGGMQLARRVYEDSFAYRFMKMEGCMEDGSVKSFFPNGFAGHIYAETLLRRDLDYETELADYFSHLYGEDWKTVRTYLDQISDAFDFGYMQGEKSVDPKKGPYYNPSQVSSLLKVAPLAQKMRDFIEPHIQSAARPRSVAWRALWHHTNWCENLADIMADKCQGRNREAIAKAEVFFEEFGKNDYELENIFDFILAAAALFPLIRKLPAEEY